MTAPQWSGPVDPSNERNEWEDHLSAVDAWRRTTATRPDNHPTRARDLASERPPRHLAEGLIFDRWGESIRNNRTQLAIVDAWYGRRPGGTK